MSAGRPSAAFGVTSAPGLLHLRIVLSNSVCPRTGPRVGWPPSGAVRLTEVSLRWAGGCDSCGRVQEEFGETSEILRRRGEEDFVPCAA